MCVSWPLRPKFRVWELLPDLKIRKSVSYADVVGWSVVSEVEGEKADTGDQHEISLCTSAELAMTTYKLRESFGMRVNIPEELARRSFELGDRKSRGCQNAGDGRCWATIGGHVVLEYTAYLPEGRNASTKPRALWNEVS